MDWCWHSDFIFRDKTRSRDSLYQGRSCVYFLRHFTVIFLVNFHQMARESATKRLTRNFAPPFSLDCKQESHSYLPPTVSTRFFVRWNEHVTTDILTLACMGWGNPGYQLVELLVTLRNTVWRTFFPAINARFWNGKFCNEFFFFFVKKCKLRYDGRILIDKYFFFLNNWYENIFLVFFMWNNLTIRWIGFIENLILFATLFHLE